MVTDSFVMTLDGWYQWWKSWQWPAKSTKQILYCTYLQDYEVVIAKVLHDKVYDDIMYVACHLFYLGISPCQKRTKYSRIRTIPVCFSRPRLISISNPTQS